MPCDPNAASKLGLLQAHLGGEDGQRRFTLSMDQNESRLPTSGHFDIIDSSLARR